MRVVFYKTTSDGQKEIGSISGSGLTLGIGDTIKTGGYTYQGRTISWGDKDFFENLPKAFDGSYFRAALVDQQQKEADKPEKNDRDLTPEEIERLRKKYTWNVGDITIE